MYQYEIDDEMPKLELIARTERTARYTHKCGYCFNEIEPGTSYYRIVIKLDDEVVTLKSHSPNGQCGWY